MNDTISFNEELMKMLEAEEKIILKIIVSFLVKS